MEDTLKNIEKHLSRVSWLLGAMESHTELSLRLRAQELGIPVVWWDPTKGLPPDDGKVHGESAELKTVYQFLPERLRGK